MNEHNKAIIYAESPYQLLNSLDYINVVGIKKIKILIRDNGNEHQKKQFIAVLKKQSCVDVKILKMNQSGLKRMLQLPWLMFFILKGALNSQYLVFGDARSIVSKVILNINKYLNKEVVLVDDGLYLLSYCAKIINKKYTIFTNLPLEKVIGKNGSLKIINKEFTKVLMGGEDSFNFIGMKLSEIGFMNEGQYIDAVLGSVNNRIFTIKNYFAHRGESDTKLQKLSDKGFTILRNELPIEEYCIVNGAFKGVYCTFYSTALYNLQNMLDECEFYSIKPSQNYWPKNHRDSIETCYNLFENSGVSFLPFIESQKVIG